MARARQNLTTDPTEGVPAQKRGFHHGDLRRAALREALLLISEQGAARLSLREVARRCGVDHSALYGHFASKDALLDAIIAHGFAELACMIEAHAARDMPGAVYHAYLDFALTEPALYDLIFSVEASRRLALPAVRTPLQRVIDESAKAEGARTGEPVSDAVR
ncbi:MAG: hypothetical protein RL291_1922, partial [Pseudomonadota bacterium]